MRERGESFGSVLASFWLLTELCRTGGNEWSLGVEGVSGEFAPNACICRSVPDRLLF